LAIFPIVLSCIKIDIMNYDLIVIGTGPGGYVAAIRAAQLGLKTAVVEKENLGGVCLNWGCIPTKALLKSAQVFEYLNHASEYGIEVGGGAKADFSKVISRSRGVADGMSKGIQFLMKKNKIDVITGAGKLKKGGIVEVTDATGKKTDYSAKHIILATGAHSRELPNVKQDGKNIIGYREAMTLATQPKSMVVMGSGAIGMEFAYFYNTMGTQVTVVEFMDKILPREDMDVSKEVEKIMKKKGLQIMTGAAVEKVEVVNGQSVVTVKTKTGTEKITCDVVLSAVGIATNIEGIGLEEVGVKTDKGLVVVDDFYKTNIPGVYAIGDIVKGPALAHVASAEGITCVEKIAGKNPEPIDYGNIPSCTYCIPEVASVGLTEEEAKAKGYTLKVGKFPFSASGKASASGAKDGFVKVIYDAKYGEWLGAHLVGMNVTEMIAEVVVARKLETTGHEIIKAIHPHPTMSEAIMEATAAAFGEVIHL
jgi:dihydrolipoamide dehydrogenase